MWSPSASPISAASHSIKKVNLAQWQGRTSAGWLLCSPWQYTAVLPQEKLRTLSFPLTSYTEMEIRNCPVARILPEEGRGNLVQLYSGGRWICIQVPVSRVRCKNASPSSCVATSVHCDLCFARSM